MGIELEDYTGISPRTTIYSAMDDFSGATLIGPIHDETLTNVTGGKVTLRRYTQIGCNSVIFPSVTIEEGTVVGAMSLVNTTLPSWGIYTGIPARRLKDRSKELLKLI